MKRRCAWSGTDPLYIQYHDHEWGVPVHNDRRLFEMLILEGAQAGLSWLTVLKKREAYRQAFDDFDPSRIAKYDGRKVQELINNPGIIRNRLKIQAAIQNAQAFLKVVEDFGSFDRYIWQLVGNRPVQNQWKKPQEIPARTQESDALSEDLKKRGYKFVGSTICYAYMQAVGMGNDHLLDCFRHSQISLDNPPSLV